MRYLASWYPPVQTKQELIVQDDAQAATCLHNGYRCLVLNLPTRVDAFSEDTIVDSSAVTLHVILVSDLLHVMLWSVVPFELK